MIKVKWLESHPAFGYFAGQTGEVSPEWAEKLLAKGFILPVPDVIGEVFIPDSALKGGTGKTSDPILKSGASNTLPEDLPGKDKLLAAGFDTPEKIKEVLAVGDGDGLLDAGISVTMLKKIKKYFKG